jgi:hypothetical protein
MADEKARNRAEGKRGEGGFIMYVERGPQRSSIDSVAREIVAQKRSCVIQLDELHGVEVLYGRDPIDICL